MHRGLFSTRETGSLNQFEKADTHRTISSVCLCVNWNACEWNAHSSHPLRQHKNAFTRETKIVQASWRYCPIWPTKSHLHFSGQSTNLHKHTQTPLDPWQHALLNETATSSWSSLWANHNAQTYTRSAKHSPIRVKNTLAHIGSGTFNCVLVLKIFTRFKVKKSIHSKLYTKQGKQIWGLVLLFVALAINEARCVLKVQSVIF